MAPALFIGVDRRNWVRLVKFLPTTDEAFPPPELASFGQNRGPGARELWTSKFRGSGDRADSMPRRGGGACGLDLLGIGLQGPFNGFNLSGVQLARGLLEHRGEMCDLVR